MMSISSVLRWCFSHDRHIGPDDGARQSLLDQLRQQAYLQDLLRLTCAQVMRAPPVTVRVDDTIGAALKLLDTHHIKLLPVVGADGRLEGVVTHVDLQPLDEVLPFLKLASDATAPENERRARPVSSVMSVDVRRVDASAPLTDVIPLFSAKGHHHLPVVDEGGRVVGVLTQADIMKIMCGR
jgi:CBS domain-containing membrane protein